jgi:sugar lactone lactonase YvrE
MQNFLIHWKLHWLKYLIGILFIFITVFYFYTNSSDASGQQVFQKNIGQGCLSTQTKTCVDLLSYPQAIAIDSQGNKYFTISDVVVVKYDTNDNFVLSFGGYGTSSDKFGYIERMTVDQQGNLYVTDNGWNGSHGMPSVKKFDPNGNFIMSFGSYSAGGEDGTFKYVDSVAVEPSTGNIYVSDYYRNDIQVFSPSGTFITKFGSSGSGDGQFNIPYGIVFDKNGDIYVADMRNHRIQKFSSSTHVFISKFGTQGSGDGQLNQPMNLVIDNAGDILVNDTFNSRIQKFSSTTPRTTDRQSPQSTTQSAKSTCTRFSR